MSRNHDNWGSIVSALALGIGIGAALGVVLAPQSGEDTRAYLKGKAQDGVDEAVARGKKFSSRATKALENAADTTSDAVDSAQRAFHDARNSAS